ncbi:hypothetical protein P0O15_07420 [Methanotrichaceae archaeon Mx]|uniref:Uncharacterized protein n=1 Tax=Candidatus Methanocrinis natronophilus TaxID=3033396 RepID=A0ABT5X8J3_9EURY|nr:hypothetical protein [Candidatus Methanocrinis natronophilus]
MSRDLEIVLAYHEATKHAPARMAPGPGGIDWENEPAAFRRYLGAPAGGRGGLGASGEPLQRQPPPHRRVPDIGAGPRPLRSAHRRPLRPKGARPGGEGAVFAGGVAGYLLRPAGGDGPRRLHLHPLAGVLEVR